MQFIKQNRNKEVKGRNVATDE